jgi:hypothetical protein
MTWSQADDPLGNPIRSTLCAALPILVSGGDAKERSNARAC